MNKQIYFFSNAKAEGSANMKNLLGGKGANLAEMTNIGLPVPPGFTITTEVCNYYYSNKNNFPKNFTTELNKNISKLEKSINLKFGDNKNPLLVSVRSGARASMPGMMDTILNLGINDSVAEGLIKITSSPRFVYDSYRRFVQMYGDVVMNVRATGKNEIDPFESLILKKKKDRHVKNDTELDENDLFDLVHQFKKLIKQKTGKNFPTDPIEQLYGSISAVFKSWMNSRAIAYRKLYNIPENWGTAVNVQAMVFGNMGNDSGTGVAFTRNPANGENEFYGEYLMNAQGEDVVAGTRTPIEISFLKKENPKIFQQLLEIRKTLEKHYREMMDIEFTIQNGKLFMLQCRVGKRTAIASIQIAVDMVNEKLINKNEAILRIEPEQLNQLLRPIFDSTQKQNALKNNRLLAKGLNAGPGAATGRIVFTAEDAEAWHDKNEKVILCRIETSPEDIKGMEASEGFLTAFGGMTSHAALVARQMGKVCVAGCSAIEIDYMSHTMKANGKTIHQGDWISIDGSTGEVIEGKIETKPSEVLQVLFDKTLKAKDSKMFQLYNMIMKWSDEIRSLKIRANADQGDQANKAIAFGAEGIGLCRTEHMFFGEGKIGPMREMILATGKEKRIEALNKLLPIQQKDFENIFIEMKGFPVTIRTLDPPLHEFLPHEKEAQRFLAREMNVSILKIRKRVLELHEFNPMLGFRGCRLGTIFPEITEMQTRAIFNAAANVTKMGIKVFPEIMIPLVGNIKELSNQVKIVRNVADEVMKKKKIKFDYLVGTMIEVPRGAITAGEIATEAEFFSFGTNDLTQMTLGISRDDAAKFLVPYVERKIYDRDPFETIDRGGVGELMKFAISKGRETRKNLKIGICGEHGGDPQSIEFCHNINLNYVSCSPFRIPIARLAAAQAVLKK